MNIRVQLSIMALTTLLLPWAGCQYARELETTLRVSQELSLQASAATMAHALSAQPQDVFRDPSDTVPFASELGDLYVFPLHNQPLLDGYREDWDLAVAPSVLPTENGLEARMQAGFTDRYLFLYLEVDDAQFDPEPNDVHPEQDAFDRVNLTVQWPDGALQTYFIATAAPGLVEAQTLVRNEAGAERVAPEQRIQAFWLQTSRGYHLEARIPRDLVGSRLWIEAIDGSSGRRAGFLGSSTLRGGRLFSVTPGLDALLSTFIGTGTRATVINANSFKLGSAGSVAATTAGTDRSSGGTLYRRFVTGDISQWPLQIAAPDHMEGPAIAGALAGQSTAQWSRSASAQDALLSAAAPIVIGADTRGAVVLEQAGDQFIELRDRALRHLFNMTLLATTLAVLVAVGVATWISVALDRLRVAADTAVGNDGRVRLTMPESQRGDEIGALARAFERLLGRLNEHVQYLRTLGGKLSHELRTPLTIVRSSLDNLESEGVRQDQQGFVTRARTGVMRLQSILSALGAASKVEESIKLAERVNFDLTALMHSAIEGYRDAFPRTHIELDAPSHACFMNGAPDLIVQMLDKLMENAVDFCPLHGAIRVRLGLSGAQHEISVSNDGPPIPAPMLGLLFESLFEHREGVDDKPHFGLGLYIVRLIAEFHGGTATAFNRSDASGAKFVVVLPII